MHVQKQPVFSHKQASIKQFKKEKKKKNKNWFRYTPQIHA